MRRILIPTDFSETAMNAVKYALELFKNEECEVYFMHAYHDEIYADEVILTPSTQEEITQIANIKTKQAMLRLLEEIHEVLPNQKHKYLTLSCDNVLIEEADKVVDENDIDIIIMGTQGKSNDRKLTFGSHTLQILKYVQCPVLAIPENCKYNPPKHILFPTNYMIPFKHRELHLLNEIIQPFHPEIDLLYISLSSHLSSRQEDNRTILLEELYNNKINLKWANHKDIGKTIFSYIDQHDIDMLVMLNTKHSFLENILFQSVIDQLSLNIKIPFLAMQNMRYC